MKTSTKVAGFTVGLAAVFALGLGAGAVLGPEATPPAATHSTDTAPGTDAATDPVPAGHGH
ncbi:hypothetical protein LSF60_12640 [Rhodococcus pyridinivorans]|uniref:hypothetical protein n=1 Tax=Rhodococcus TaxID=1827 RepID=UPI001E2E61E0|nr:hypothetical protein [Rhodococcus pyridinivorans]UGQ56238.1 hypothetical protein LSF60_12640 [Rhodococcus pyridinivorans]